MVMDRNDPEFVLLVNQSKMAKQKTKQRVLPSNPAIDASKQKEFNQKIQEAKEKVLFLFIDLFTDCAVLKLLSLVFVFPRKVVDVKIGTGTGVISDRSH